MPGEKPVNLEELFSGGKLDFNTLKKVTKKLEKEREGKKRGKGVKPTHPEKLERPEGQKEIRKEQEWVATFNKETYKIKRGPDKGKTREQWVKVFYPKGKELKCIVHPKDNTPIDPDKRYVFKPWEIDEDGSPVYRAGNKDSDFRMLFVKIVRPYSEESEGNGYKVKNAPEEGVANIEEESDDLSVEEGRIDQQLRRHADKMIWVKKPHFNEIRKLLFDKEYQEAIRYIIKISALRIGRDETLDDTGRRDEVEKVKNLCTDIGEMAKAEGIDINVPEIKMNSDMSGGVGEDESQLKKKSRTREGQEKRNIGPDKGKRKFLARFQKKYDKKGDLIDSGEIEKLIYSVYGENKRRQVEELGNKLIEMVKSDELDVERANNIWNYMARGDEGSAQLSINNMIEESKSDTEKLSLNKLLELINELTKKEDVPEESDYEDAEGRREKTEIEVITDILRESEYLKGSEVAKRAVILRVENLLRDRKYQKALDIIDKNFNVPDDKEIGEKIVELEGVNPVLNEDEQKPEATIYGSRESEDISPMERSRKIASRSIEKMTRILDLELREGNIRKALLALNKNYPFTALRFLENEEERLHAGSKKDRFSKMLKEGEEFDDNMSVEQKLTHFKAFVEAEQKEEQEDLTQLSIRKLSIRLNSLIDDFMENEINDKKDLMDEIREFNSTTSSDIIKKLRVEIFNPIRKARDPYAGQTGQEDEAYRDMNNLFSRMIEKQERREGKL